MCLFLITAPVGSREDIRNYIILLRSLLQLLLTITTTKVQQILLLATSHEFVFIFFFFSLICLILKFSKTLAIRRPTLHGDRMKETRHVFDVNDIVFFPRPPEVNRCFA